MKTQIKHFESVELGKLRDTPLVSIIVPSFNQGAYIGDTLRSILEQDYRPIEVHVIDGASTDATLEVLKGFSNYREINWISEPDRGVVEAVNKGFCRAEGEILAIQSSDDLYLPGAVATMVQAFRDRPKHGLLYADIQTVDTSGNVLSTTEINPFSVRDFLRKQTWIPQPSAFFRREMLTACGGWDERYFNADTELWMRMAFRTEVEKLDAVIARRRRHEAQRDHQAKKIADSYRAMLRDSIDVRNASPEIRRAARAGAELHSIRYNASGSDLVASMRLWRAILADPSLWETYRKSPLLIPGRVQVQRTLSSIKRMSCQSA